MSLLTRLAKAILYPVRIAFIDDDEVFLKSLHLQARACNSASKVPFRIEVKTFLSPAEFEEYIHNPKNPGLDHIFVDLHLNEKKGGSEYIKEWISSGKVSKSRILILSGDRKDEENCNPFVWNKPFILLNFISHLKEILSMDVLTSRILLVQSLHMTTKHEQ